MILHAMAESVPPDNSGTTPSRLRELQSDATDYDQGVAHLRSQLAADERLIAVRVQQASLH